MARECHSHFSTAPFSSDVLGESSPQKRAPELNPIERLWEDLKKYFKGRNFDNLATFRDEVFGLINSLCPTTIVSLTGWSYILDALNPIFITSA